MYQLEKLADVILQLIDENVVIGGKVALQLHGLKMTDEPKDIDFIIYNPTAKQFAFLNAIRPFDLCKDHPFERDSYPTDQLKVMKFKKNDIAFDIIQEKCQIPKNLLTYRIKDSFSTDSKQEIINATYSDEVSVLSAKDRIREIYFKIQSIKEVIKAKVSYTWDKKKEDGLHTYMRSKDLLDLIDLKNQNFNV